MFSLAVGIISCAIITLGPSLVHGAPSEPSHLERRIAPDNVAMYTPDYFLKLSHKTPVPGGCLFYTAGLTEKAVNYARGSVDPTSTIWDIWDPVFYNRSQDVTNPLRNILKFQTNINPDTQTYFRHMSEAFAALCTEDALVLTNNSYKVNEKGIWGQVQKPTLQKTGNVGGQSDQIDACEAPNCSNRVWPPYWVRPGTNLASILASASIASVSASTSGGGVAKPTAMPKVKPRQTTSAWTGAQLAQIFSDIDPLW